MGWPGFSAFAEGVHILKEMTSKPNGLGTAHQASKSFVHTGLRNTGTVAVNPVKTNISSTLTVGETNAVSVVHVVVNN